MPVPKKLKTSAIRAERLSPPTLVAEGTPDPLTTYPLDRGLLDRGLLDRGLLDRGSLDRGSLGQLDRGQGDPLAEIPMPTPVAPPGSPISDTGFDAAGLPLPSTPDGPAVVTGDGAAGRVDYTPDPTWAPSPRRTFSQPSGPVPGTLMPTPRGISGPQLGSYFDGDSYTSGPAAAEQSAQLADVAGTPASPVAHLSPPTVPDPPRASPSARARDPHAVTAEALSPGDLLGDYRLEEKLGQGATASVWKAVDVRLDMPVALKLFTPRTERGRVALTGVMREARAASRVVSDHVIRVKDAGRFEDMGLGFIAMELCADYPDEPGAQLTVGTSLDHFIPVDLNEAVRVIAEAARGVADAHREGVFHRDIKPANILVRPGSRRAQITDFGLTVAEFTAGRGGSVRLPVQGQPKLSVVGTPEYMAPEAAAGLPRNLDPERDRAQLTALDVYGLGATLYAICVGRTPYERPRDAENPVAEVLHMVQAGAPDDLLQVDDARWPITEQVARVVRKATARTHPERYHSADALAEDLEAIVDRLPTTRDQQDHRLRWQLYLLRNRPQVAAAASLVVVALSLAAALSVGLWLDHQVEVREARIAELDQLQQASQASADKWEASAKETAADVRAKQADLVAAREEIATTETSLGAAQRKAQKLAQDLAVALATTDEQSARADAAEASAATAQAEAEASAAAAVQADAERDQARAHARTQAIRAQQSDDARVEAESRSAAAERTALQAEAAAAAARVQAQQAAVEADQATKAAERAREQRDQAKAALAGVERKLAAEQQRREVLETEVSTLQRKLATAEQRLRSAETQAGPPPG